MATPTLPIAQQLADLHRPYAIYSECDHDHGPDGLDDAGTNPAVVSIGDIGDTCAKAYDICKHCCCDVAGDQSETCIETHRHGLDKPICPTSALLPAITPGARIVDDIHAERQRQDAKWGYQQHSIMTWSAILSEESGEVAQACLKTFFGDETVAHLREELVQVAAVAVAWIEHIDAADPALLGPSVTLQHLEDPRDPCNGEQRS